MHKTSFLNGVSGRKPLPDTYFYYIFEKPYTVLPIQKMRLETIV